MYFQMVIHYIKMKIILFVEKGVTAVNAPV